MRFSIERASDFYTKKKNKPCDGAELIDGEWYIDIPDLSALLSLIDKEVKIVMTEDGIIIYDDYIE